MIIAGTTDNTTTHSVLQKCNNQLSAGAHGSSPGTLIPFDTIQVGRTYLQEHLLLLYMEYNRIGFACTSHHVACLTRTCSSSGAAPHGIHVSRCFVARSVNAFNLSAIDSIIQPR